MQLEERGPLLSVLARWLDEVRAGEGRFVLMGGEAGVGKTALVDAFIAALASVRVLWAACDALFTPEPLAPLFEIAEQTDGALMAAVLAARPRRELFGAFLEEIRRRRPTVVVIEDVHSADEATLDLLRFLARRVGRSPALLLVTYCDDELHPQHPLRVLLGGVADIEAVRRLTVPPLSEEGVRALAAGTRLDAEELYQQTGGNPFFVTAVVAVGEPGVPMNVRDAVLARADRLSPESRAVLDAASLIGSRVELGLLEAALAGAMEGLEGCVLSGMVRVEGREVVFRHELARMAIEEMVADNRKVELHQRVLAALVARAGQTEPARLAHHAEMAGDRATCFVHSMVAAERATALGAHREAATQYRRALRAADDLDERGLTALRERLAHECALTGELEEALELRRTALEAHRLLGDLPGQAEQLRIISTLSLMLRRVEEGGEAARAAVALLAPLPPGGLLAVCTAHLAAFLCVEELDLEAGVELADQAVALAEELGEPDVLMRALGNAGYADDVAGRGTARLERALELTLAADLDGLALRAYQGLLYSGVRTYDVRDADDWLIRGLRYADERDLDMGALLMVGWRAWLLLEQGRFDEADDLAAGAIAVPTFPLYQAVSRTVVGLLRARRGEADPWGQLDEAILASPGPLLEVLIRAARAEAALLGGDCTACAHEAAAVPTERLPAWSAGALFIWAHRAGAMLVLKRGLPEPFMCEFDGDHAGAAAIWEERGAVYQAIMARAFSDDEQLLRQAHAELLRLGANAAAGLVARRLREQGVKSVERGPRPATRVNPAGLTTRELEVFCLLAGGLHNKEIAGRLFVSSRTVDSHVSKILGKLGVRTRVEAAAEAARLGLGQDT